MHSQSPEKLPEWTMDFSWTERTDQSAVHAIGAAQLTDPRRCAEFIDWLGGHLRSDSRRFTASLVAKRCSFLIAAPLLYTMSARNERQVLPLEGWLLETLPWTRPAWSSRLLVHKPPAVIAADSVDREDWRAETVRSLFAGQLAPLWRALSAVSGLPRAVLWENTAVRVYSLYEKRLSAALLNDALPDATSRSSPGPDTSGGSVGQARLAQADFRFLLSADPELFGESYNPLQRYYVTIPAALPGVKKPQRIRKTCCLYYRIAADGGYCDACPLPALR